MAMNLPEYGTLVGTNAGPTANLGTRLQGQFTDLASQRVSLELELLRDERQYKGVYEKPEVDGFAAQGYKCDMSYLRVTATKVRTMNARIMDLVMGTGKKNWSFKPDDDPDTENTDDDRAGPENEQGMSAEHAAASKAMAAAEGMESEVWGQLQHARYVDLVKLVVESGHKYGTGILKGPMALGRARKKWVLTGTESTSGEADSSWQVAVTQEFAPSWEFVPIWDFYPEMDGWDLNNIGFCFQRHLFHQSDLLNLAMRPNWRGDVIRRWIQNNPQGDMQQMSWEGELDVIGRYTDSYARARRRKYEVLEYWGPVDSEELRALGGNIPEDMVGMVEAHVWVARNTGLVLAADINPTAKKERPYSFYTPFKEEAHLFGESVPSIMRDPQRSFNAANRMMADNAASAVGPQIEMEVERVPGAKNLTSMPPFRVWATVSDPYGNNRNALNFTDFPNHAQLYLMMLGFYAKQIDEISGIPAYQQGQSSGGGAGRTASGLSMLMGAAGLLLKNQLFSFDAFQARVLTLAYDWNMEHSPKAYIKSNLRVHVVGSMSLAMREMRAEQFKNLLQITNNPTDLPWMKRRELIWLYLEENEMDPSRVMKTKKELEIETAQMQKQQALAQADPVKKMLFLLGVKEKIAKIQKDAATATNQLAQADEHHAKAGEVHAEAFADELDWINSEIEALANAGMPVPPPAQEAGAPAGGESEPRGGMQGAQVGESSPPKPGTPPPAVAPSGPTSAPAAAQGGKVNKNGKVVDAPQPVAMGPFIEGLLHESQTPREYV